jgi:diguanylate cyclase (GGDEF)-like protein
MLAEITSHRDRELLEKSLLNTLSEYNESESFWLYKLICIKPNISLGLLAHTMPAEDTTVVKMRTYDNLSENVQECIEEVVKEGQIIIADTQQGSNRIQIVYPAFDKNREIFALLIQETNSISIESQRLIHGFLRIYSNYLDLIEHANRDKLTNLLNRETLDSEITRILSNTKKGPYYRIDSTERNIDTRKHKEEETYWLGVLDIDHFKKINDAYGHLYGDEILIIVARTMEDNVRDHDLVFRYGGEEFVILLKAHDREEAQLAFERISGAINQHNFAKIEALTVSIGVTQVINKLGLREVIFEADTALYYAKAHGRNKVFLYENLIEEGLIKPALETFESDDTVYF